MYKPIFPFLFCCFAAIAAIAQTKAQTLKVMTYNIYHGEEGYNRGHSNIQRIADLINEYQPDFVALQEVDSMTNRTAAFNGGVPKDLMKELAGLTGMHGYFAKAIDYSNGGYGEGILSRWPAAYRRDTLAIPRGGEGRALISVNYTLPDGRELIFAGTHLCHQFAENREAQVQDILAIFEDTDIPVIVGGDFNFSPESDAYQIITSNFYDAARLFGEEKHTYPTVDPKTRIDYIFLSKNEKWKVVEVQVIDTDPSDHLPVLVTLEILPRIM
ncbi:MAG TPA: endonuclease/exonuclease/phosphatase family protein [Sphingobacteriaceae bacterium]|nr:endonuclease/exonuclease/phosphatase family protein [Sphingobacteriaceae bacterium]